jgi:2-(1,2-epoxy-1,2-dihydrophenyl)acetyl-CoA isomerase
MSEPVLLERDGAVATIVLNRPDKLNALDHRLAEAFRSIVLDVERDEAVRCVVVRGAGRGFMAGGDVAGFHTELGPGIAGHVGRLIDLYHDAVRALARMPKPTLASLHGPVAGAGLSMALSTDLAIAADNTVFTLAYASIGTSPDGGATFHLPRIVGRRRAMEIALLSDRFDAARALDLGIVNKVVPEAQLAAETKALAARLASGATGALAAAKRLIDASFESDLASQLEAERAGFVACTTTSDFAEGVTAFVQKRKPEFHGR